MHVAVDGGGRGLLQARADSHAEAISNDRLPSKPDQPSADPPPPEQHLTPPLRTRADIMVVTTVEELRSAAASQAADIEIRGHLDLRDLSRTDNPAIARGESPAAAALLYSPPLLSMRVRSLLPCRYSESVTKHAARIPVSQSTLNLEEMQHHTTDCTLGHVPSPLHPHRLSAPARGRPVPRCCRVSRPRASATCMRHHQAAVRSLSHACTMKRATVCVASAGQLQ